MTLEAVPAHEHAKAFTETYCVYYGDVDQPNVPRAITAALCVHFSKKGFDSKEVDKHLNAYRIAIGTYKTLNNFGLNRIYADVQQFCKDEDFSSDMFLNLVKRSSQPDALRYDTYENPSEFAEFVLNVPSSSTVMYDNAEQWHNEFDGICYRYGDRPFQSEDAIQLIDSVTKDKKDHRNALFYFGLMAYTDRKEKVALETTPELYQSAHERIAKAQKRTKIALLTTAAVVMCGLGAYFLIPDQKSEHDKNKSPKTENNAAKQPGTVTPQNASPYPR